MSPKCPHPNCVGRVKAIGDGKSGYGYGEWCCDECNCEFYGKTAKEAIANDRLFSCHGIQI